MRMFIAVVISSFFMSVSALADIPRVWVQPFTEANDKQSPDWITKTLQQSLVDELAASKAIQLVQSATNPSDVQFVITGQIQRTNTDLRVTGQVLDNAGKPAGGYKATGNQRELFALEDSIADQVNAIVAPQAGGPASTQPVAVQTPFAPGRFGTFEGSDLERSMRGNTPLAPAANTQTTTVYVPVQPTYPTNYGYNNLGYSPFGYGYGYGYGYNGWPNYIYINGNNCNTGGGGGSSGVNTNPLSNGTAMRNTTFRGNPPPGVINTVSPAPSSGGRVGGGRR